MEQVTIRPLNSNNEIWDIIDKSVDHILVHQFDPHNSIQWWDSSVKINSNLTLENFKVRNMQFDIQANVSGLKQILDINTDYLNIYQFSNPISDTLEIERLPANNIENILLQNGIRHIIFIEFEYVTIKSIDSDFIRSIKENPLFTDRIQ